MKAIYGSERPKRKRLDNRYLMVTKKPALNAGMNVWAYFWLFSV
jgi:hypothetical protein